MPLDRHILVAQIAHPQCDPAFDREHPDWRALAERYVLTRTAEDLAALPLVEARKPRLYEIACVTPAQYGTLRRAEGIQAAFFACLMGVVAIHHPDGTVEKPALETGKGGGPKMAKDSWLSTLQRYGGMRLLEELHAAVICRADVGDWDEAEGADPLGLYELPRGWVPGRSRA